MYKKAKAPEIRELFIVVKELVMAEKALCIWAFRNKNAIEFRVAA